MKSIKRVLSILMTMVMILSISIFTGGQTAKARAEGILITLTYSPGDFSSFGWSKVTQLVTLDYSIDAEDRANGVILTKVGYRVDQGPVNEFPVSSVAAFMQISIRNEGLHEITCWAENSLGERNEITDHKGIDRTFPTITPVLSDQANQTGWFNHDVTVEFVTEDAVSGVQESTPNTVVSQEGLNNSVTGYVTDFAGNKTTATIGGINIDKTGPVVTAEPSLAPNQYGWYNSSVTYKFSATDALSGVVTESITPDLTLTQEGKDLSVEGTANDVAGNPGKVVISGINIDKSSPVLTAEPSSAPNEYGWYNEPVTYKFSAADTLSGVRSVTGDITLATDGTNLSVEGSAVDFADNPAKIAVNGINIDTIAPVISLYGLSDGGTVYVGQKAGYNITDERSGVAGVASGTFDTSSVGRKSKTITATDKAGNTNVMTVNYTVGYGYNFALSQTKKLSAVSQGSSLTVKFQLTDPSENYVDTVIAKLILVKPDGSEIIPVSTSNNESKDIEPNQFRYDYSSNQYIFNLNTKDLDKGNYTLKITLDDGTTQTVPITLK